MNIAHPTLQARDIATLIDNDPIMASQIKEFIRHDRLIDLLELSPAKLVAHAKQNGYLNEFLDEADSDAIADQVRARMS